MYGLTAFERDPFSLLDPFSDFDDRFVSKETVRSFKTDIREENDKFIMEAELPGFEKGEIQLDVNGDTLPLFISKNRLTSPRNTTSVGNAPMVLTSGGSIFPALMLTKSKQNTKTAFSIWFCRKNSQKYQQTDGWKFDNCSAIFAI